MKNLRKITIAAVVGCAGMTSFPALAQSEGDLLFRFGVASVMPNDDSSEVRPISGTGVSVDDATSVGLTFTYLFTDNIGIELLGALPFKHKIKGDKGAIDGVDIGTVKQLPPTLVAQYYFRSDSSVRPYLGAGINYTYFFDENADSELEGVVGDTNIDIDNSVGPAAMAGIDIDVSKNWFLNASIWYIDIDTEATLKTADAGKLQVDVDIDPWVAMIGIGTRF
jgi:outer membrane protein